jgi:hypothetical protein
MKKPSPVKNIKNIKNIKKSKKIYSSFRYSQSTDINNKTLVVRASCPLNMYLTQSYWL